MKIDHIESRQIPDSRGRPTIEVTLAASGHTVSASVPSGKSTGIREAKEKRDEDGFGVTDALRGIDEKVAPTLVGGDYSSPDDIDRVLLELDGTEDKSNLGANVTLAVSIAVARVFAATENLPLWKFIAQTQNFSPSMPRLYMNVMNGGAHGGFALPFQEYIIVPHGDQTSTAYMEAQRLFAKLGETLRKEVGSVELGDEGGYMPKFEDVHKPFKILRSVVGNDADIAIDAAATEFYKDGNYTLGKTTLNAHKLAWLYDEISRDYHMLSIEDPFEESDTKGFSILTKEIGDHTFVVGDDLTVTNPRILDTMVQQRAGNALIIKPNQIGTLSEVYETVHIAQKAGWKCIASHRSGETEDSFIADLAVAIGAYGLKAGAPTQKERRAKYTRLLEIEQKVKGE